MLKIDSSIFTLGGKFERYTLRDLKMDANMLKTHGFVIGDRVVTGFVSKDGMSGVAFVIMLHDYFKLKKIMELADGDNTYTIIKDCIVRCCDHYVIQMI